MRPRLQLQRRSNLSFPALPLALAVRASIACSARFWRHCVRLYAGLSGVQPVASPCHRSCLTRRDCDAFVPVDTALRSAVIVVVIVNVIVSKAEKVRMFLRSTAIICTRHTTAHSQHVFTARNDLTRDLQRLLLPQA